MSYSTPINGKSVEMTLTQCGNPSVKTYISGDTSLPMTLRGSATVRCSLNLNKGKKVSIINLRLPYVAKILANDGTIKDGKVTAFIDVKTSLPTALTTTQIDEILKHVGAVLTASK